MKNRILFLLGIFCLTLLIFLAAKIVFMLCNLDSQQFSVYDMLSVMGYGLSLDLSTALYVFSLPLLLSIVLVWLPIPNMVLKVYFGVVAVAMSLAFVADTSLYNFWHFKLDASCLSYLETPGEAMASVTTGYLLVRVVVWALIAWIIYFLYSSLVHRLLASHIKSVSVWQKITESVLYVLLIPVVFIGIRGGLGESTTNIGQVYFSQNQFLNHAAVNPVFSFLSSLGKSGDYLVSYDFYNKEEMIAMTDGLYPTESVSSDTLLKTHRPNILIIAMESCGGQFTSIGGHDEITPNLNRLFDESVFFEQCYANSWRTDKGMVSILSGYPAFPVTSIMKVPEKSRKLPSIASVLQAEGYATSFFYGGDINFTNMRSYVMGTGYEQLCWKADYTSDEQQSAQWGVRDDLMFASLLDDIKHEKAERWMKTMLTLSSHEPWDVPTKELDDEVFNAFHYLDHCIGDFLDSLRLLPLWDNLLVVILPDHGYRYQGIDETTRLYNHIPLIWTGGAILSPKRVTAVCNQSDLAATLLGQMQIDHSAFTFSRDVVSKNYQRPFAFHTYNNGVTLLDSVRFAAYDMDAERMIAHEGDQTDSLLQLSRAILQLTSHDLISR